MARCQPGDMAWVISSVYPENLGLPVKVLRRASHGVERVGGRTIVRQVGTDSWVVESQGRPILVPVFLGGRPAGRAKRMVGVTQDRNLLPWPRQPLDETVETEQPVPELEAA